MPDMREALRQAGLRTSKDPRDSGAREAESGSNPFPPGYPRYFTAEGHTRVELVKEEAARIAERFAAERLTRHQLRGFFDHAKKQLQRLQYGAPFGEVHPAVVQLKAVAADRARRAHPIPRSFKEFIDRNIDAIADRKSFEKGFMPHFEAVVGYCAIREN